MSGERECVPAVPRSINLTYRIVFTVFLCVLRVLCGECFLRRIQIHIQSSLLFRPAWAISAARSSARALFWVSIHSLFGTESATMPAPACT